MHGAARLATHVGGVGEGVHGEVADGGAADAAGGCVLPDGALGRGLAVREEVVALERLPHLGPRDGGHLCVLVAQHAHDVLRAVCLTRQAVPVPALTAAYVALARLVGDQAAHRSVALRLFARAQRPHLMSMASILFLVSLSASLTAMRPLSLHVGALNSSGRCFSKSSSLHSLVSICRLAPVAAAPAHASGVSCCHCVTLYLGERVQLGEQHLGVTAQQEARDRTPRRERNRSVRRASSACLSSSSEGVLASLRPVLCCQCCCPSLLLPCP